MMLKFEISRPYSKSILNTVEVDDLCKKLIKCEEQIESNKRLIGILDDRAGPAIVDDNDTSDDSDSEPIPNVEHEVEQRD